MEESIKKCSIGFKRYSLLDGVYINTSTKVTWINFDDLALPCY